MMSVPKQCPELPTSPKPTAGRPRRKAAQKARKKIADCAIAETRKYEEKPCVQPTEPSYKNVDWQLSTVNIEEITIRCGWKRYFNIGNSSMIFKKGRQTMNVWLKGKETHFISIAIKPMNVFRKELSLDGFEAILVDKSKNILTDEQMRRIEMNKQRALQRLAENKAKRHKILEKTDNI